MNSDGSITFSIDITNIGSRAGSEVVQLYISDLKCSLPRPVKELKAFDKVSLNPGETKTVHFTINKDALSFFDAAKHAWVAEPGMFKAHAAAASDDVRSSVEFQLK
jgi:beta-glucosidase